jgi:hypothetical protein
VKDLPSTEHDAKLDDLIALYKGRGYHVIRLDKSANPDAILIDWKGKQVLGLEVETRTHLWLLGHRKRLPTAFDGMIYALPKPRTKRTASEYWKVKSMCNQGRTKLAVSRELHIPIATVHAWLELGKMPPQLKHEKALQALGNDFLAVYY